MSIPNSHVPTSNNKRKPCCTISSGANIQNKRGKKRGKPLPFIYLDQGTLSQVALDQNPVT